MLTTPIDPLTGPQYALQGRVVTMDSAYSVLDSATIYIDAGKIVAVQPMGMRPPAGYENIPNIQTQGTIYPGLIELHNHLSYNALQLWQVPRLYTNRDQWSGIPEYRKLISGPMAVLGHTPGYVEAIVRFVECKCLFGGVTTSQGIALYSNQGITQYYRGIVRNVEQTEDADLPEALSHLADIEAVKGQQFLARLRRCTCLLLHLSEGTDEAARSHFTALHLPDNTWAITPALAGIHSLALEPEDFQTLQVHGGAMIWSPLSNLLLYGKTADVKTAKQNGVRIGIGSDWSPSGSKNLLGELKVAHLYSAANGSLFTDRELLSMATRTAAEILHWEKVVGTIEAGKRADLVVVAGDSKDPYTTFLQAHETDITFVIINGVPRCGDPTLMMHFGNGTEQWQVGQVARILNLAQATANPIVEGLSLLEASDRLRDGLNRLPQLASDLEHPKLKAFSEISTPQWYLRLDQAALEGISLRPFLDQGIKGLEAARERLKLTVSVPLSQVLEPMELDALTVADDTTYIDRLRQQGNLPNFIKQGLPTLY